ncbi:hypothetical protein CASFOL_016392 [Castilleja foliolosa]|uniref:Uncharacterized protein n=1 Tax=Castilleja foliolosa TaxID=1961234 RepID=A0ABD3DK82_9LAMI
MSKTQTSTSGDDQTLESARSDVSTTTRDSQQHHRSESSCSNSLFVNPTVSFPTRKFPEISKVTVGKSSACSDISDSFNCTGKTLENISDNISATKGKFDLNEDIYLNGTGDLVRVIPKIGIPSGRPVLPLEFKGGLGWTGSAETSAFRPVSIFSKNSGKNELGCCFTGFDLNVAAVDDTSPHTDFRDGIISKPAETLCIDLNRLYDAGDEFTQPCAPAEPEKSSCLLDLNVGNQDFNPVQRLSNNSNSALNPKLPFLPPQSYYFGTPSYFQGLFNEQRTSNVITDGKLSNEARQFLFLDNNSSRDEHLQKHEWFGTSMKRKEPDRGSGQIRSLRAWL